MDTSTSGAPSASASAGEADAFNRHLHTHADHPIAGPIFEAPLLRLLERSMAGTTEPTLLDLGCGEGAWLNRALTHRQDARAVGVDTDGEGLERGLADAARRGVADRLRLVEGDVRQDVPDGRFDVVLCVGSTHAYGGLIPTLRAAGPLVDPEGVLLVGEGFWEREPDEAALNVLGVGAETYAGLPETVDQIAAEGWLPIYGHVSTPEEWDDYEWSWTGSLTSWALDHPDHPEAAGELAVAGAHRDAWLRGYRGTLGFVTLALRRATAAEARDAGKG